MLSLKLGFAKMNLNLMVFGCGANPVAKDVKWFVPPPVITLNNFKLNMI